MINYIQFVKEVIEYSGSNCVDHLTYLHMSTESVKVNVLQIGFMFREDLGIGFEYNDKVGFQ